MRYLLDTTVCIDLIRRRQHDDPVLRRLRRDAPNPGDAGISVVTLAELEYGCARSSDPARNRVALAGFVVPLHVAPLTPEMAHAYGELRARLERAGTPIGPLDTLIAAHALALRVTLVTSNLSEFQRVPELQVENWRGPA